MHEPLARALAERGNRVVTIDLLGHGRSDRPKDMSRYSMTTFGEQVVALLDHLEIDEAVVIGTSLGANTTLEVASLAPERLRGMIVEMPVLDNALLGCAIAFTPLMVALTAVRPLLQAVAAGARRSRGCLATSTPGSTPCARIPAPRRRAPGPVLRPHRTAADERRAMLTPALVIGHAPRPRASVLRRGHARRRAAQRLAGWRRVRASSCASPRAADR